MGSRNAIICGHLRGAGVFIIIIHASIFSATTEKVHNWKYFVLKTQDFVLKTYSKSATAETLSVKMGIGGVHTGRGPGWGKQTETRISAYENFDLFFPCLHLMANLSMYSSHMFRLPQLLY